MTLDELPWTDGAWGDATQRAEIFLDGVSHRFYRGGKYFSIYLGKAGMGNGKTLLQNREVLLAQAYLLELIKDKTVTF